MGDETAWLGAPVVALVAGERIHMTVPFGPRLVLRLVLRMVFNCGFRVRALRPLSFFDIVVHQ